MRSFCCRCPPPSATAPLHLQPFVAPADKTELISAQSLAAWGAINTGWAAVHPLRTTGTGVWHRFWYCTLCKWVILLWIYWFIMSENRLNVQMPPFPRTPGHIFTVDCELLGRQNQCIKFLMTVETWKQLHTFSVIDSTFSRNMKDAGCETDSIRHWRQQILFIFVRCYKTNWLKNM